MCKKVIGRICQTINLPCKAVYNHLCSISSLCSWHLSVGFVSPISCTTIHFIISLLADVIGKKTELHYKQTKTHKYLLHIHYCVLLLWVICVSVFLHLSSHIHVGIVTWTTQVVWLMSSIYFFTIAKQGNSVQYSLTFFLSKLCCQIHLEFVPVRNRLGIWPTAVWHRLKRRLHSPDGSSHSETLQNSLTAWKLTNGWR